MAVEFKQRVCACCEHVEKYVTYDSKRDPAAAKQYESLPRDEPHFDQSGQFWCDDCWELPVRKKLDRVEKLRVMAERGSTEAERANAQRRLAEAIGEANGVVARARLARAEQKLARAQAAYDETQRKIAKARARDRKRVRMVLATFGVMAAGTAFTTIGDKVLLPETGPFYSILGTALTAVAIWYAWHPFEDRWTIRQAIAYAVYFAVMGWCSLPFLGMLYHSLWRWA